jgi:cystathionine beta-lyase/cystathionine gamma-synthase
MAEAKQPDIGTQVVHAGERSPVPNGSPVATPIYATATFTYETMAAVDEVFAGDKQGYIYTRYGNPTIAGLETAINTLEGGAGACAYASGMAALHAALFACDLTAGATIVASQDLYGATIALLHTVFGSYGIKTVSADFNNLKELEEQAKAVKPRVLIAETISNPLLKVCDLAACADIAHAAGARLIVDNTFATPYLCRPIEHGADLVVHSATKYFGGHADATGGLVVTRDPADLAPLIGTMKLVGGVLSVWEAHQIMRGVKTLGVRLDRQCSNAARLAEHLANQPRVLRVFYPEHAPVAEREVARRMLGTPDGAAWGALVSIELSENTREVAFRFMDALRLCVRATSLGDVFSSVSHPASASHREVAPARRRQLGISDGLMRISVGIESLADIIADVDQALAASVG